MAVFTALTVLALLSVRCLAQVMITSSPRDATVVEGGTATFQCAGEENGMALSIGWRFTPSGSATSEVLITGTTLTGIEMVTVSDGLRTLLTFSGVRREADGGTVQCVAVGSSSFVTSDPATLTVQYPPQFSPSTATATPTEGEQLTLSFSIEANPPLSSGNITLTRSGTPVTDARVTVTTTSLTIADVTRGDSDEYQITASNVAGSATFSLTVDVYYPPEFTVPSQNETINAARNEVFTFDCTPSGGNPAVYSYTFLKGSVPVTEGVSGSVLTINPVVRSSRGMYTCTANNTAGTAEVTRNLFVVDVPMMPLNPRVVDLMSFSATLQWDPPSDNGGSSLPLTYTITLTNTSTSLPFSDITATSLPLPILQHSTQYSWSVQAINEYGSSPPAEGTFTTPDSVPIIDSVEVTVLSLFEVEVNISLLTNGGQSVTQYIVEVNGINYIFLSSEQMRVSLLVKQLRMNFTKGGRVTLRAFTVNSVGTSDPVSADVIVPSPPSITALPHEVHSANIPVCCAGVQLNLAKPDDPSIRVQVLVDDTIHPPLVDGTLHPANYVTRNGSFLYIMGLQAGTEYSLNITLSNIFGTVWVNTTVRPLLGRPSTPQVALTHTAGGLTVQLTVMYPGTREDSLQYSISTSPSPLSRRQTGQQPLPVTDLTTPISGSAEVALGPWTYSVTVTVTNQHGSTMSVPQEVTIPGSCTCPESTDQTPADLLPAVIVLSAVLAIVVVFLAVAILNIVLLYTRNQKFSSVLKATKGPNYQYAEMEMGFQNLPKSHSKSITEPQYEECGGGVISSNVAMEENPAYQSVDVAGPKP